MKYNIFIIVIFIEFFRIATLKFILIKKYYIIIYII